MSNTQIEIGTDSQNKQLNVSKINKILTQKCFAIESAIGEMYRSFNKRNVVIVMTMTEFITCG